jgi:hypothetical protein
MDNELSKIQMKTSNGMIRVIAAEDLIPTDEFDIFVIDEAE